MRTLTPTASLRSLRRSESAGRPNVRRRALALTEDAVTSRQPRDRSGRRHDRASSRNQNGSMSPTSDTDDHQPLDRLPNIAQVADALGVELPHVRRIVHERGIPYSQWDTCSPSTRPSCRPGSTTTGAAPVAALAAVDAPAAGNRPKPSRCAPEPSSLGEPAAAVCSPASVPDRAGPRRVAPRGVGGGRPASSRSPGPSPPNYRSPGERRRSARGAAAGAALDPCTGRCTQRCAALHRDNRFARLSSTTNSGWGFSELAMAAKVSCVASSGGYPAGGDGTASG
jgi:hypothetical protein